MRFPLSHQRRSRTRGFTMVEVLIAIGIFSMVMAAIYSTWSAVLRSARVGVARAGEVQRTRVALRALQESLAAAVLYADNAKYYSFFADSSGDGALLSFVARLPESFPGSGVFEGERLRRVTFSTEKGQLLLMQSPILEATSKLEKPYTIVLAPQVKKFALDFFDARKGEWVADWFYTNQMPRMMRVALSFTDKNAIGKEPVRIRTIRIEGTAIARVGAGGTRAGQLRGAAGLGNQTGVEVIGEGAMTGDDLGWGLQHLPSGFGDGRGVGGPRERDAVFGTW